MYSSRNHYNTLIDKYKIYNDKDADPLRYGIKGIK